MEETEWNEETPASSAEERSGLKRKPKVSPSSTGEEASEFTGEGYSPPSLYLIDAESRVWAEELMLPPDINLRSVRELARVGIKIMCGKETRPKELRVFVQVDLDKSLGSLSSDAEILVIHQAALDDIKKKASSGGK